MIWAVVALYGWPVGAQGNIAWFLCPPEGIICNQRPPICLLYPQHMHDYVRSSPPSRKYEGHQHQIETHFVLSVEYSIFPLLPWMALTSPCEWASNEDSPFESNDVNPSPSLPGMVHKSFPPLRPLTATVAQEKKEKTALSSHYLQIGWVLQMVRRAGESSKKCGETFIFFPFVRNSKSVKILLSAHPSVYIRMFACSGSAWKSTTGWIVEQTLPLANIFWQHLTQRSIKGR